MIVSVCLARYGCCMERACWSHNESLPCLQPDFLAGLGQLGLTLAMTIIRLSAMLSHPRRRRHQKHYRCKPEPVWFRKKRKVEQGCDQKTWGPAAFFWINNHASKHEFTLHNFSLIEFQIYVTW
jgi:hypothetical protein